MRYLETILPLYGSPEPVGCSQEEIAAMKARFGALPAAVEDFYRTAAKTPCFQWGQDDWILPEHYQKWTWLARTDALILLNENQGVCQAGVLKKDLSLPDPPVYVTYKRDFSEWKPRAPTVSEFLAAALAYEAAFTHVAPCSPEEFYWFTPSEVAKVKAELTRLPFSLLDWCSEMEITLYQNAPDNLLVLMDFGAEDGEPQALYGAATQEGYQKLLAVAGGLGEAI